MPHFAQIVPTIKSATTLQVIGQDMHIMNPSLLRAVEQHDSKKLAAMALQQVTAGADALDLNLGAARSDNDQLTWAVQVIQDAVQVPLFISSHALNRTEVMRSLQNRATINSVTADPITLAPAMQHARQHNAQLVVLLTRPGLTPFTADERLQIANEVLETAVQEAFPLADLYLDPLFHLRPDPMTWQLSRGIPDIDSVLETVMLLPQLSSEKVRTVLAISTASQFLPTAERSGLHRRLLPMLVSNGLDAVILNSRDSKLMEVVRSLKSDQGNIRSLSAQQVRSTETVAVI